MNIIKAVEEHIDGHYRRPAGTVGRIIGDRMDRQHQPENAWAVTLLQVQPTDHILEIGFGPGTTIQRIVFNDVVNLLLDAGFASARVETGPVPEQFKEIAVIGVK